MGDNVKKTTRMITLIGVIIAIVAAIVLLNNATKVSTSDNSGDNMNVPVVFTGHSNDSMNENGAMMNETMNDNMTDLMNSSKNVEGHYMWTNPNANQFKPNLSNGYSVAPNLKGATGWINSEPFTLEQLRGKVVIVDFWTYSCINCIRTLPYLVELDKKYRDKGLVIVGVHTPEFEFEKNINNVKMAVEKYGVEYPVMLDSNRETWNAYQNRYWPRKYIIDANGQIRFDHIGEGGYEETEKQVQQLLAEIGQTSNGTTLTNPTSERNPTTPELYAGYDFALPRGESLGNVQNMQPEQTIDYKLPENIPADKITLEGRWKSGSDALVAKGNSAIVLKFTAKSVNIVTDSNGTRMNISLDKKPISKDAAGADASFDGDVAYIVTGAPQLYNVYSGDYGTHTLRLDVDKGFSFNSFTFG